MSCCYTVFFISEITLMNSACVEREYNIIFSLHPTEYYAKLGLTLSHVFALFPISCGL